MFRKKETAFNYFMSPLLAILIFVGVVIYFKFQDSNADFLFSQASLHQQKHREFVEFYGEIEPDFPIKDLNSKTIMGIDANSNGIRDDVDVWINRTAFDLNETKAMRQFARGQQKWLSLCEHKDFNQILEAQIEITKSEKCLSALSDYQRKFSNFSRERLNLLIFNTDVRKSCNELNSSKEVISESEKIKNSSLFYCDFEIQYLKNVNFGNNEWKKHSPKKIFFQLKSESIL